MIAGTIEKYAGNEDPSNPLLSPVNGDLDLPAPVNSFTGILGAAACPCALFSMGLFLVGKPLREGSAEIAAMALAKLVLHPLLTAFAILVLFPTEPLWATVAILLAALPIGSGPFVLAQAQGIYVRRTSTVMLVTTVVSVAIDFLSDLPAGITPIARKSSKMKCPCNEGPELAQSGPLNHQYGWLLSAAKLPGRFCNESDVQLSTRTSVEGAHL